MLAIEGCLHETGVWKGVYTHIDAKGGLLVLKEAPTPEEIVKLGEKDIIKIWKDAKLRGNGHKKGNEYPECGNEKHRIKSRPYRSMDGDTGSDRGL